MELIENRIYQLCDASFTTVLLNLYRDGKDSNGWHADDEPELGKNPVIASVSLGAPRFFHLRHNPVSYTHLRAHETGAYLVCRLLLEKKIYQFCDASFTTVLLNLYRDGKDSNGWHADNEPELGKNPVIASVSLGAPRFFHLRHNHDPKQRYKLFLEHGSLLLMGGVTQHFWKHQVAKTTKKVGPRINLTFRKINHSN